MPRVGFTTEIRGPFFSRGVRAIKKTQNDAVMEVVMLGEALATQKAQPSPEGMFHTRVYADEHGYFQTGNFSRSIEGRPTKFLHGMVSSNSLYGRWLEGDSSRNVSSRFKGYHLFRKTRDELDKKGRGILLKHISKYTRRFG